MLLKIILSFSIGVLIGFILEFSYRSVEAKRLVRPKIINVQMYGLTGILLALIYSFKISLMPTLVILYIIPVLVEFITGYTHLRIKGIRLWDYSKERFNFLGIICLRFSLAWFIISGFYYYLVLPKLEIMQ
ncbi:MAG: hypothetical protein A3D48_00050 [Candidatus Yanofskybacteria bacterium RIFCSPHIGHO2_02_FULL_43_17]|nr:MAG: hypothetical protein A3D48_00050 [Candidatus Yanofskybacteria bacterium RIFCSPHIGHO2_02_FULL_43_17]